MHVCHLIQKTRNEVEYTFSIEWMRKLDYNKNLEKFIYNQVIELRWLINSSQKELFIRTHSKEKQFLVKYYLSLSSTLNYYNPIVIQYVSIQM
jgi:hypothetical protein